MPVVSRPQPGRAASAGLCSQFRGQNIWRIETPAPGAPASRRLSSPSPPPDATYTPSFARWPPRGLCSNRSGDSEIWLADPDGSNAVQLTSLGARERLPTGLLTAG